MWDVQPEGPEADGVEEAQDLGVTPNGTKAAEDAATYDVDLNGNASSSTPTVCHVSTAHGGACHMCAC